MSTGRSKKVLGSAIVTNVNGATIKMDVTPFQGPIPIESRIKFTGYTGDVKIQKSDDGGTVWADTGVVYTGLTTFTGHYHDDLDLSENMRYVTANRSAGTVDEVSLHA